MHAYNRTFQLFPELDFASDRAQAPLLGFVVALALSVALWVTVGWSVWALLH